MKPKTIEHMQYFVGKVCTIITSQINRQFDERIMRDHYAIRVGEITLDGIWGVHPEHDIVSFFPMDHIVSIHEELELNKDDPEHRKIIREYEEKFGKKPDIEFDDTGKEELLPIVQPKQEPSVPTYEEDTDGEDKVTFVDIKAIGQLAKHTKRTVEAQKILGSGS